MSNKIQFKRGAYANVPVLNAGEPAFTTDSKQLIVGDGTTNYGVLMGNDSAWITLPLINSVQNFTGYTTRYRKFGKFVHIDGYITNVTAQQTTIATLPTGFRPSQNITFAGVKNGYQPVFFEVHTDGSVILAGATDNTYTASNFMSVNIKFMID